MSQLIGIEGTVKLTWSPHNAAMPEVLRTLDAAVVAEQSQTLHDVLEFGASAQDGREPVVLSPPHVSKHAFNTVTAYLKRPADHRYAPLKRAKLDTPQNAAEVLAAAEYLNIPKLRVWATAALQSFLSTELKPEHKRALRVALSQPEISIHNTEVDRRLAWNCTKVIVANLTPDNFAATWKIACGATSFPARTPLLRLCTEWAIAHIRQLQENGALQELHTKTAEAHAIFIEQLTRIINQHKEYACSSFTTWRAPVAMLQALVYGIPFSSELRDTVGLALRAAAGRGFAAVVRSLLVHPVSDAHVERALGVALRYGYTEVIDILAAKLPIEFAAPVQLASGPTLSTAQVTLLTEALEGRADGFVERMLAAKPPTSKILAPLLRSGRMDLIDKLGLRNEIIAGLKAGDVVLESELEVAFFDRGHSQVIALNPSCIPAFALRLHRCGAANSAADAEIFLRQLCDGEVQPPAWFAPETRRWFITTGGALFDRALLCNDLNMAREAVRSGNVVLNWNGFVAVMRKDWSALLLEAGLLLPAEKPTAQHFRDAACTNDIDGMQQLLDAMPATELRCVYDSALQATALAVHHGQREMVRWLRGYMGQAQAECSISTEALLHAVCGCEFQLEHAGRVADILLELLAELSAEQQEPLMLRIQDLAGLCRLRKADAMQYNALVALLPEQEARRYRFI